MQLVAYGVQDVYLTGNPQITYFKVIYRRHTNFCVEPIEQSFSGTPNFDRSVTALLARNGDLITKVYLKVSVEGSSDNDWAWVRRLGHAMIKDYNIQIGGATIDSQTGDWMNMNHELAGNHSNERGYAKMVGDTEDMTVVSGDDKSCTMYVPLGFWFCRNNGLALPLIALQFHDVRMSFNFESLDKLVNTVNGGSVNGSVKDASLLVDYVFLDTEERKRFATSAHEYLIETVQNNHGGDAITNTKGKFRLVFNHPCKAVYFAAKNNKFNGSQQYLAYHPSDKQAMQKRFAEMVYLMCLNVDSGVISHDDQGKVVTVSSEGVVASAFGLVKNSVVMIVGNDSTNNVFDGSGTGTDGSLTLPEDFSTNPFAYIEFVDDSWKNVTDEMLSTPVADMVFPTGGWDPSAHCVTVNMPHNYTSTLTCNGNPIDNANIQLNGQDRFARRDGAYFNYVQPWQHFSNTPADGLNVYSFALNPEEHQPSGTCNFSRIDFAQLSADFTNEYANDSGFVHIYAVNYNVLRIMGGMGGLAYSN